MSVQELPPGPSPFQIAADINGPFQNQLTKSSTQNSRVNPKPLKKFRRPWLTLSCGLYVIRYSFQSGHTASSWKIQRFLRNLFWLFKNSPVRLAHYTVLLSRHQNISAEIFLYLVAGKCGFLPTGNGRVITIEKMDLEMKVNTRPFKIVTKALNDEPLLTNLSFSNRLFWQLCPFYYVFSHRLHFFHCFWWWNSFGQKSS